MRNTPTVNRYVRLTEAGAGRIQAARRRFRATVEDIVGHPGTPSINTVKRALKQQPVFVSTIERIWDYFRQRASEAGERMGYLLEGEDFFYVEETPETPETQAEPAEPIVQSRGWISRAVPRPNRLFTGRRDALDRLHEALRKTSAALIADPQALTGLGGIGKTQTAIAYIYEHWRDYARVFWVTADTVESLDDGLAAMAEELGLIPVSPSTKAQALRMIHDWLAVESDWLLVLDNADDIETLAAHFPRHHAGRLILTSRARSTVKWASPIPLRKFGPEDGALLLLRRAGILDMNQELAETGEEAAREARALSEELDGLPLAIDQAGAYLAETGIDVADYRARYRQEGLTLLDSAAAVEAEHASVSVTFTLAVRQMCERTLYGAAAVEMVRLGAFLVPEEMPEAVFAAYPFPDSPPREEVYAAAGRFSLVSRNAANRTFTMHRLVQIVVRDGMDEAEKRLWRGRAVEAVSRATPDFEYEDWALCDQLLPQWRACIETIRQDGIETESSAYLLYQAARYLRARALYAEAESCIRDALAIAERLFGPVHAVVADYADELACLCRTLDRRDEAERLHARAVDILERVLGPDHVLLASKLHNWGVFYIHAEQYPAAEAQFLRALAIHEKQEKPDEFLVATALTQLAGVYRMERDFGRAETCCRRALETYERILEPGHVEIATACNNLALLYLTMGRCADADRLYARALAINEQARGKDHPETAHVLWGLARVRWRQDRPFEADALFRRALAIDTRQLGPSNSRTLRIAQSYAEFQRDRQARV
jgi:tetratricopeptide (TPR) repeat protein